MKVMNKVIEVPNLISEKDSLQRTLY